MRIIASASGHIPPEDRIFFPCVDENGERVLNLTPKNADKSLQLYAEYAFQVFKFLSQATGDDWDILETGLRPGKGKT